MLLWKLDGVGPIDNRHFTNKPHHFVQKKREKEEEQKKVTHGTWHLTPDMSQLVGVNIISKCQLPNFNVLGLMMFCKIWRKRIAGRPT